MWSIAFCIWLAESFFTRAPLDADAIAYLDIARSCLAGNWHALINGYWSPAFPTLLAFWIKLTHADRYHDLLALQLFGAVSLAVAAFSFEYFLSAFFRYRAQSANPQSHKTLSDRSVWWIGYSLFFWIATFLTPPSLQHPDILVFIIYLLASGLCLQLLRHQEWWRYALLGLVLALGYFAKAVMLPLAVVFLFALFLQTENRRKRLPKFILAALIFFAIIAPFASALSHSKGRFTFGDVGAINYRHIMGFDSEATPTQLVPSPAATPHASQYVPLLHLGTYPPWADPSHGFTGGPFRFDLRRQLNRTHVVLHDYFDIYIVSLAALGCGLLALFFASEITSFARRFLAQTVLWLPAAAGLAFYATVRVSPRFLGGFTIGLFAAWIVALLFAETPAIVKTTRSIALAVCTLLLFQSAVQAGHDILGHHDPHSDWDVANALHKMGVQTGDSVSYMGDALLDHGWAYVAGVKIAAEIPAQDALEFWAAADTQKEEVMRWLAATGSKVLVTRNAPNNALFKGWVKIGDTDYYILPISTPNPLPAVDH